MAYERQGRVLAPTSSSIERRQAGTLAAPALWTIPNNSTPSGQLPRDLRHDVLLGAFLPTSFRVRITLCYLDLDSFISSTHHSLLPPSLLHLHLSFRCSLSFHRLAKPPILEFRQSFNHTCTRSKHHPHCSPSMWFALVLLFAVAGFGWAEMTPLIDCMSSTSTSAAMSCTAAYRQWGALPQIPPTTTYYDMIVTHQLNVGVSTLCQELSNTIRSSIAVTAQSRPFLQIQWLL